MTRPPPHPKTHTPPCDRAEAGCRSTSGLTCGASSWWRGGAHPGRGRWVQAEDASAPIPPHTRTAGLACAQQLNPSLPAGRPACRAPPRPGHTGPHPPTHSHCWPRLATAARPLPPCLPAPTAWPHRHLSTGAVVVRAAPPPRAVHGLHTPEALTAPLTLPGVGRARAGGA